MSKLATRSPELEKRSFTSGEMVDGLIRKREDSSGVLVVAFLIR